MLKKLAEKIKNTQKFLYRFFEPAFLDKREAYGSLAAVFVNAVRSDILPIVCIPFLITFIQNGEITKIYLLSIFFIIISIMSVYARIKMPGWYWYSAGKFNAALDQKYRKILLLKDNLFFEKIGTGKVQSIFESGLQAWSQVVNESLWHILKLVISLALGIFIMIQMSWWLILLFISLLLLSLTVMIYFKSKKFKLDLLEKDVRNKTVSLSVRSIMSRSEILFSGQIEKDTDLLVNLKNLSYKMRSGTDKYGTLSVAPSEVSFLILPFLGVSLYIFYNGGVVDTSSVVILTAFVYFSIKMSQIVISLILYLYGAISQFVDVKKLWDFLDETPDIKNYETGKEFVHGNGKIEMRDVNFSYDKEKVLENFDLHIKGGSKVALVGRSGSGKTTIAKLVTGYLKVENKEPQVSTHIQNSGQVLIDGQDILDLSLKSYYKYVGYLTQEPMVFDGSIKENLLYAVSGESVGEAKINEALTKAHCDFVFNLKDGIETEIGEKGIRLSGGERQRLAIAKLFLKNPEIIVLDEPTSALDSFSEDAISKSLDELFRDRTVIIIAHRLQTVKKADEIVVLENGRIVERGSHVELVNKQGHYAKMLELQGGF